ncbi:hypothetical protein XENOCAPTIV_000199 [Xenoophorus captivus]|uniref:NPAS4 bHLH domain-containing protein n=1 Tax=Xenoophorus captivus TaxID=1517983 RepID=A0ABV0RW96_9TELE
MRSLLPISQEDQERLSYLHSMAAICTYIRKSTSKAFKLQHGSCCSMLVRGRFQFFPQPSSAASPTVEPLFVALCTPTVNRLTSADSHFCYIFSSTHRLDMSFTQVSESETEAKFLQKKISSAAFKPSSVPNYLFFAQEVPQSQSVSAKCFKRRRICSSQSEELGARTRRESEQDIYCAMCPSKDNSSPVPLGESPALFTPPYSPASSSSSLHQEELSPDLLMDVHECKDQLPSSPEASPSYYSYQETGLTCHQSPADSLPTTAEQGFDCREFDLFTGSSPFSSSSSVSSSSPNYDFQACSADARLVPDCFSVSEMCESQVECASLHPDDINLLDDPQGGILVQLHQEQLHQEIFMHSSILTPTQSPIAREPNLYDEREQAEISILAQQISSLASSFNMNRSLNPLQNVIPAATANRDWLQGSPLPLSLLPKHEPAYDDCTLDSILKDLNMVSRKSSTPSPEVVSYSYQQGLISGDSLPAEQFSTGGIAIHPFSLQLENHGQNIGLHQLNHYMQISLQQGKLFYKSNCFHA